MGPFSLNARNGLVSAATGASGFPAVDVGLVPRLDTVEGEGFVIFLFLFLKLLRGA